MPADNSFRTSLHVNLRDKHNGTYRGQLLLKNWTLWYDDTGVLSINPEVTNTTASNNPEDIDGAVFYVIAVILVYGMSIVMLIASHINRKHSKLEDDRQILKYLQEFQVVKEKSSQESYKDLKKKIKEQIHWDRDHKYLQKNLSHAVLPMIAVTMPRLSEMGSLTSLALLADGQRSSSHSSIGHSSPVLQPRTRANSCGDSVARHGRYLAIPDHPDSASSSPKLTRDRRKGLAHLFQNKNIEPHHLEQILEESLDSRGSSFRRKDSKKSIRSTRSNSLGSIDEVGRSSLMPDMFTQAVADHTDSFEDSQATGDVTSAGAHSPDSGVTTNQSLTPDVVIEIPDDNNDDVIYSEDENAWLMSSDVNNTDDEEQYDEAYESGRYITNGMLPSTSQLSSAYMDHVRSKRYDYPVPNERLPRLTPLYDEYEYYSDTSSDSDGDMLYVTSI